MKRFLAALLLATASVANGQSTYSTLLINGAVGDVIQYAAPSSGATVAMGTGVSALVLDNVSLLATLTVTLPPTPTDGQRVTICSGAGVTLLTVNGGTVKGLITSLSVNGYARYMYSASANAWFRTG